jgi:hypothetical protein
MPSEPPRSSAGAVVPHDHPEILDEQHVIRHTVPHDLTNPDDSGQRRISSGAYSDSGDATGGMSVDIEEWMMAEGLTTLHYLTDTSHGAKRIKVGDLRALGLQVGWAPEPDNRHHALVWGISSSSRRKKVAKLPVATLRKTKGET